MLRSSLVLRIVIVSSMAAPCLALAQEAPGAPSPPAQERGEPAEAFSTGLEGRSRGRVRPGERVELSLEDGDLDDLIRLMTSITGHRYIVTGTPRQIRATIASSQPVTAAEAYRAFVAILHQNGMTVVESGRYHVIRSSEAVARGGGARVHGDDDPPPADERFVTWIHRVSHMPIDEAAALLEPLRSTEGQLITHAPTRTLILVETGANIARLRRILRDVDVAGGDVHMWVEPLHHGDAEQIAEQVRALFLDDAAPAAPRRAAASAERQPPAATPAPIAGELRRVLAEPRTNQLIVVGTEAGYRRVIAFLRVIDRAEGDESTVHVHRLQHGDAEAVAATLQRLLGGSGASTPAAGTPAVALASRVGIEAHTDLNAVVITATASDYRRVRRLVEELDAPPRQVFLEMVLMELSVDGGRQMGVNVLSGIAGLLDPSLLGFVAGGGVGAEAADLLTGIAMGLSGPMVSDPRLPGGSAPSFGVLVHALSRSTQANILSTPHVLVLDNREAVINVGENVPLQGSSVPGLPLLTGAGADAQAASAAASALATGGSAGRRDTGTIVHVTPHINDDGEIRLEIEAEDSRQGEVASGNLSAVALRQSIAQTELVVRDGQTAVIGGLMRDSVETVRTGVPFLSEIPVLGALFGSTDRRTVRRNLLFFVTPYVVRGPEDMRAIFERRMRERREFLERHYLANGEWEPPLDYARTRGLLAEMLDRIAEFDAETERTAAPDAPARVHTPGAWIGLDETLE